MRNDTLFIKKFKTYQTAFGIDSLFNSDTMDPDFRAHFQPPSNYSPPTDAELIGSTQYPNLNSIEYRNLKVDPNIVKLLPFYESIAANEDQSTLLLTTNSYTGRLWNGSIFGYHRFEEIGVENAEQFKLNVESNISGIRFLDKQMVLFTTACGSIQLWSTQSEIRQKDGYNLYQISKKSEHIGVIGAMDVLGKGKALTGSSDGCIKLWDIGTCDLVSEKTYRYAHCGIIHDICSRPDSDAMFASCSQDRYLAIWDKRVMAKPIVAHCKNPTVDNTACLWRKEKGKEFLYLGDNAGDVYIFDPRKLDAPLDRQQLFDRPIHKFKIDNGFITVLAHSQTFKVLDEKQGLKSIYESSADDYVRDVCWLKGNDNRTFYTVGWSRGVHKHIIDV